MSELKLTIIADAVRIRVQNGEKLDAVLDSYPRLYKSDKVYIKDLLKKQG